MYLVLLVFAKQIFIKRGEKIDATSWWKNFVYTPMVTFGLREETIALEVHKKLMNPVLVCVLWLERQMSIPANAFISYCSDTLLLTATETTATPARYDFPHRAIKNHFAIRPLMLNHGALSEDQKLTLISKLSQRGEEAFEALCDIALTDSEAVCRAKAVHELSNISDVDPSECLLSASTDDSPDVRVAVVINMRKARPEQIKQIAAEIDKRLDDQTVCATAGQEDQGSIQVADQFVEMVNSKFALVKADVLDSGNVEVTSDIVEKTIQGFTKIAKSILS